MAPRFPDEVNVFIVPHSRMKDLVHTYRDQMSTADFRSHTALETLLPLLEKTFTEFKTHEHIENEYIMERLKQRLKMVNVSCQSVCNCHGDSRLIEILNLLKDGYSLANKSLPERIDFGSRLQKALMEFTEKFIPHMQEEEEVFQPLLMKYFAYEELRLLKEQVIQQHEFWKEKLMAQKETAEVLMTLLDSVASKMTDQETLQTLVELTCEKIAEKAEPSGFDRLPEEMITHIFSYLGPLDRTRCARVCKHWNLLVYSPHLWKRVYPANWAKGLYDFVYRDPYTLVEADWSKSIELNNQDDDEDSLPPQAQKEKRFYEQFIRYGLMRFGDGVQHLVVAGGLHLPSNMFRSMLLLCPNVTHLDASYTHITDLSFKWLAAKDACSQLVYLDLSGCRQISDVGLERLGACFKSHLTTRSEWNCCLGCASCRQCPKTGEVVDLISEGYDDYGGSLSEVDSPISDGLTYLSLSGCTSVTDYGLQALLEVTLQMDSLSFMDLSGCPRVSASTLNMIAECSSRLSPQDLYYCNMIQEGPYPDEANGCQNLECPLKNCCCSGQ